MKKVILLLLVCAVYSTGVTAQTNQVKKEEKDLKNTIKDKREDKKEANKDLSKGKVNAAIVEHKEVRKHNKSIRKQGRHLRRRHGVKHPIQKARHKIKVENESKSK